MVASTNSNGFGRTLMQTDDSPTLQNRILSHRRFSNTFQSYTNESPVTKEKFECQQCGKQFGNQHILKLHTRIHASQSLLQGVPGAAATLTQNNGTLNFNITVDFSSEDQNGTILRERLTNILKSQSLWEKVSQSLANIRGQSLAEKEKQTGSDTLVEKEQCQLQTDSQFTSVVERSINIEEPKEQNMNGSIPSEIPSNKEEGITKNTDVIQPLPSPVRTHPISRGKKAVGLTKIRMEDCRRCDACSCIYMDERDYLKHMKNFHKHDIKKLPPGEKEDLDFRPFRHKQESKRQRQSPVSPSKKCRSCCKQCKCKGNHDTLQPMLPILRPILGRQPNRLQTASDGELPSDIKDRWKQVVNQRLSESSIAEPSESDISHLLSQVEVKIKTEPTDMNLSNTTAEETEYFPQIKDEVLDTDVFEY